MRFGMIVVSTPLFNLVTGLNQTSEPMQVQTFIAELTIQALHISILASLPNWVKATFV